MLRHPFMGHALAFGDPWSSAIPTSSLLLCDIPPRNYEDQMAWIEDRRPPHAIA